LRTLWVIAVITVTVLAFYFTLPLTYPFLVGFLLALAMRPMVSFFNRKLKMPSWLSVTTAIVLIVGVFGGLLTLVIIRIVAESNRLVHFINLNYEEWFGKISTLFRSDALNRFIEQVNSLYVDTGMQETMDRSMTSIGETVANFISGLLQSMGQGLLSF